MNMLLYFVVILFMLFSSFVYFTKPLGSGDSMLLFTDVAAVLAAFFSFLFLAYALTAFIKKDKQRLGWLFLTAGLGLYFLGETSWFYIEIVKGIEVPYPSIADLFWLVGYLPIFVGLVLIYKGMAVKLTNYEKTTLGIFGILIVLLASWFLFIPIIKSGEISITEKLLDLAYPIWDVLLAIPALGLLLIYGRGLLGRTWLFISLGFLSFTAADLLFSHLTWVETYGTGSLVDLLWLLGDALIAIGAIYQVSLVREAKLAAVGTR